MVHPRTSSSMRASSSASKSISFLFLLELSAYWSSVRSSSSRADSDRRNFSDSEAVAYSGVGGQAGRQEKLGVCQAKARP